MSNEKSSISHSQNRKLIYLSLACWGCFVFWAALYYFFWRAAWHCPHGGLAVASLFSMLGLSTVLLVACTRQLWACHHRCAVVGWLLIGITPISWFGAHRLYVIQSFQHRVPSRESIADRVAACWLSSFFHASSWLQFEREVQGRHVVFMDDGQTVNAQQLVAEMDNHVDHMLKQLCQEPLKQKLYWIRGSILGMDGFATGPWAFCGRNDDVGKLTSLDRHEIAHALIFTRSDVDQDPPSLLVEGWAESQGTEKASMIKTLDSLCRQHDKYRLDELIEYPWYNVPRGPVYSYGGPLVVFLMERFSPERFFELYSSVRCDSFRHDVERVLGESWSDIEVEFWDWMRQEVEQASLDQVKTGSLHDVTIEFGSDAERVLWSQLSHEYQTTQWVDDCRGRYCMSGDAAYVFDISRRDDRDGVEPWTQMRLNVVVSGEQCWMLERINVPFSERMVLQLGDVCASVVRDQDDVVTGFSAGREMKPAVRAAIGRLIDDLDSTFACNPSGYLDDLFKPSTYRRSVNIQSIVPPSAHENTWKVRFQIQRECLTAEEEPIVETVELWLERSLDLAVTKLVLETMSSESSPETRFIVDSHFANINGRVMPIESFVQLAARNSSAVVEGRLTARPMTQQEVLALKQTVEKLAFALNTGFITVWETYLRYLVNASLLLGICLVATASAKRFRTRENEAD